MTRDERAISRRSALAFPGQGGDWPAAMATLAARSADPLVVALADRLSTDRWNQLDPLDTRHAQPAVFVAGLVGAAAASARAHTCVALGHSLGEITAATWAGAMTPADGLDLVVARAALGHRAHRDRPSSMAVLMRWTHQDVEWLRRRILGRRDGILEIAVQNSPAQYVLTGDAELVAAAVALANDEGAVARLLPIDGAYHCQILVPELERYGAAVDAALTADPEVPVACSTDAGPWTTRVDLARVITRSLVLPVRWPDAIRAAVAAGAAQLVDAGPGSTLARLARFLPELPAAEPS